MTKKSSEPTADRPTQVVTSSDGGVTLTLFVPPVPASRPRVTRYGTYYGKTYKEYRDAAHAALPYAKDYDFATLTGPLLVEVEFVCHKPKTTKRLWPKGDLDNHEKAIFDAITGTKDDFKGWWNDDDQIVFNNTHKRFTLEGEPAHTRIQIRPLTI